MQGNKQGQVGETVTWEVATLIILFTLLISVYAASLMPGAVKIIKSQDLETFLKEQQSNVVLKESLFAFLLTKNAEGKNIYSNINSDGQISPAENSLGTTIFSYVNYSYPLDVKLIKANAQTGVLDSVNFDKQYAIGLIEKNKGGVTATI